MTDLRRTFSRHAATAVIATGLLVGTSLGLTSTSYASRTVRHTGSTAVITADVNTDPPSLDPAKGFDPISWSFLHATFVTLLTFTSSERVVPWGATAMPTVTNGGTTYTFHLRPGMKFTDGEPVTAQAYADALERILDPATKSLLMAFFQVIKGGLAYSNGKAKSVSGIQALGTDTLRVTLTMPDRTFLDLMAIPNASAVPPKVIAKHSATFGLAPVGDGPYMITSYVPGKSIVMVKNPGYFLASTVATKQIDVTIGLTPQVEALAVQNGTTDVMMDPIPTSTYLGVRGNPRYASYLHVFSSIEDNYVAMNMQMAPFTSILVREAAAYAVNQDQVLKSIAGMGTALTQILAPGMPGFDPSVKVLGSDPAKSRRLLKQAGHPGGKGLPTLTFAVATGGFTAGQNVAEVVQQELEQVGFKVQLKVMAPGEFLSTLGKYPLTMGIYGLDYPDPYDLINSQFACSEIAAGNNWQYYCNHAVDAELAKSLALPLDTAIPVYRKLQAEILADFPWIPLYYLEYHYLESPKLTGFGASPTWPLKFASWSL
ncbi:MAG: ABC transporter substrate-binding protein [Actinomycetota bacterium]|nr:ABC transporter substrate-binding protein [Actinomycetota bacterium]